ncbi:uncharacterized protein LOC123318739 [Coccinella septempunctata]|uniref:uncharacterized protein LOC123318739 n=1 Tax=Coccinella septempunctata TaxID=41139 RepID=UPI001D08EA94|nr:uncharacterized protein LOC123318739 [Coccinella septempunctata]
MPRAGGAHQLFMIHWMRDHTAYPMVFCMMPNRTRETYTGVLRYTRQLFGASHISFVLCDYELALRHAVREVFAGIFLRGCWFHFAKNVFLKARQMHINNAVAVRMAMALPLLPAERISEGIDFVCERISNDGFTRFMQRQWRNTNISVFGFDNRTNNAIESLHGQLLKIIGRAQPNFWVFVQFLQKFEHYKCSNLIRVLSGLQLRRRGRRRYIELNQRINNAQHQFEQHGHLRHFLSVTSHTVIGIHRLFDPNVPIEEIPDTEGMVLNDVQSLEEAANIDLDVENAALVPFFGNAGAELNHIPDLVMLQDIRLNQILAFRSKGESLTLLQIYMEEEVRHQDASLRLPYGLNPVKAMMQRERRKVQPPIPASLEDAALH